MSTLMLFSLSLFHSFFQHNSDEATKIVETGAKSVPNQGELPVTWLIECLAAWAEKTQSQALSRQELLAAPSLVGSQEFLSKLENDRIAEWKQASKRALQQATQIDMALDIEFVDHEDDEEMVEERSRFSEVLLWCERSSRPCGASPLWSCGDLDLLKRARSDLEPLVEKWRYEAGQRQASDKREVTDTAYVQNKLLEKSVEYLVMVKDEPKLGVIAQLVCWQACAAKLV